VDLVREAGPAGVTLREAARRAGVSSAAPYRHFADKEALVAAVAEEGFRALGAAMAEVVRKHRDPLAQLEALGVAYVRFAVGHPSHYRVMFGPEVPDKRAHPGLHEVATGTFNALVSVIAACQATDRLRAGDPTELAEAAWALTHGLADLVIDGHLLRGRPAPAPSDVERLARRVVRLLREGLESRS
jgi:AcrR family transcriptional regulator